MRLSELRPCSRCHGPAVMPGARSFYLVEVTPAVLDPIVAGAVLGQQVGAVSLELAETMVPNPEAVRVLSGSASKLLLCASCYFMSTVEPLARPDTERLGSTL